MDDFIRATKRGKRLQKGGKKIREDSQRNYLFLRALLSDFSERKKFPLRIRPSQKLTKKEFIIEKNYWKKFYNRFTDYLYDDCGHYDNTVASNMKLLKAFLNFVNTEKGWNISHFYSNFHSRKEEIQIVVLTPERLNYLIYDCEKSIPLSDKLKKVKDIFVFGCTVALRSSDLLRLSPFNLEWVNNDCYLKVSSKKTLTDTRMKLPQYAIDIINRYRGKQKTLLPVMHSSNVNKYTKELLERLNWTEPFVKTRQKRGIPEVIYRDKKRKEHYRFCDVVTPHTMRRTAITTMLSLGMNEQMVRSISGHSAGSKEFYRYVAFAQSYLDKETDCIFEKLKEKKLKTVLENEPVFAENGLN